MGSWTGKVATMLSESSKMLGDEGFFGFFRCVENADCTMTLIGSYTRLKASFFGVDAGWQRTISRFRIRQIGRMRDFAKVGRAVVEAVSVCMIKHGVRPLTVLQKPDDVRSSEKLAFDIYAKTLITAFGDGKSSNAPEKLAGLRIVAKLVADGVECLLIRQSNVVPAHMGTPCN